MNRKIKITVALLVVGGILLGGYWVFKTMQMLDDTIGSGDGFSVIEKQIINKIARANYCSNDVDCIIVDFGCPFGCGSYVNRNASISPIKEQIQAYYDVYGRCSYECVRLFLPKCENSKCTPKICETGKYYSASIYLNGYNAIECKCPEGTVMNTSQAGTACLEK
jgi:hypothetical protein